MFQSASKLKCSPYHSNNAFDAQFLGNSQLLSSMIRETSDYDKVSAQRYKEGAGTDVSIAASSVEECVDSEKQDTNQIKPGSQCHPVGFFDGTDEPGNAGFAESVILYDDPKLFAKEAEPRKGDLLMENYRNNAAYAQAEVVKGKNETVSNQYPLSSSGRFIPPYNTYRAARFEKLRRRLAAPPSHSKKKKPM